jgi:epoxyqueuosine reductase QueG
MITSMLVKDTAQKLGADLCGIASVERFNEAPSSAHPRAALSSCNSVIVVARRFLLGTIDCASTIPYTIVRNQLSAIMDRMTLDLSYELERRGAIAVPTGAIGPTNLDRKSGRFIGLISLKHAAEEAGLGRIGKNTLLVNERFGNMIWLGGVLTDIALEPDPLVTYETCPITCDACIRACPINALGNAYMNQKACWEHAFGPHDGGEWRIKCHRCRSVCPNHRGISKSENEHNVAV